MRLQPLLNLIADVRTALSVSSRPVPRRLMYAQLGDQRFELVGPVVGIEGKRSYAYAQHEIIEGKPRLQSIGDALEVLTLTLEFRREFTDPVIAYAKLCAAAQAHQALPLLFAGGQVFGRYVITEISDAVDSTNELGAVIKRRTKVELTEWVDAAPLEVQSRARRSAAVTATKTAPKVAEKKPNIFADPASIPLIQTTRRRP